MGCTQMKPTNKSIQKQSNYTAETQSKLNIRSAPNIEVNIQQRRSLLQSLGKSQQEIKLYTISKNPIVKRRSERNIRKPENMGENQNPIENM